MMYKFLEKLYLSVNAKKEPNIVSISDPRIFFEEFSVYKDKVSGVLLNPWSYSSEISCPVTYDNDDEGRILREGIKNKKKWLELYKVNALEKADLLVVDILDKYEPIIDDLQKTAWKEEASCQLSVDEYIFLGAFSWLVTDLKIYQDIEFHNDVLNFNLTEIFKEIVDSNLFMLTFENIVFISELDRITL